MLRLKAYKYRVYPDKNQEILLNKTFGCCRFVWNKLVENFNNFNPTIETVKVTEKTLKDQTEFDFLKEISAASLQQKRIDFDETKKQFFNKNRKIKIGRMQFKSKRNRQSFRLPNQKFSLNQEKALIRLEKIGFVKIIIDRKIPDTAEYKSVTVSKEQSGKYYVSVLIQINNNTKPLTGKSVGIDLGLKDLFILSDGQIVNNPKWFRESQTKLKNAQRHLNRKIKGSNRQNKQRLKVAKIHEKNKNQRNNFIHEITTSLVNNYDVICIEDLNIKGMIKNHTLAKSIQDASWGKFLSILSYKCNWYGKTLVKIDRFYPSSKLCSSCGHKLDKLDLKTREWICPECGTHHDRDLNAAKNILKKGFSDLIGQKISSVECIEYGRGEAVRPELFSNKHHLASSMKRLVSL